MSPNPLRPARNRREIHTQHYRRTVVGRTVGLARIASNIDSAARTDPVATCHTPARSPAHILGRHSGPDQSSAHIALAEQQTPPEGMAETPSFRSGRSSHPWLLHCHYPTVGSCHLVRNRISAGRLRWSSPPHHPTRRHSHLTSANTRNRPNQTSNYRYSSYPRSEAWAFLLFIAVPVAGSNTASS